MFSTSGLVLPPIVPIDSSKLSFWGGCSQRLCCPQRDGRPPHTTLAVDVGTSIKSPLRTSRIRPRSVRVHSAGSSSQRSRLSDAPRWRSARHCERSDKLCKGRDRRVPRVLHRERKGPRRTQQKGKPFGASRDHRKSPNDPGRRPSEKNCAVRSSVTAARWHCTASI